MFSHASDFVSPHLMKTALFGEEIGQSVPAYKLLIVPACHAPIIVSGDLVNTANGF